MTSLVQAQPSSATPAAGGDGAAVPAGRRVFDALDGYRGVAALCVVVFHLYQFSAAGRPELFGGVPGVDPAIKALDSAVDLFFVLSAFLLMLPFAKAALQGGPPPSLRAFFARRSARILPLYLVAITVVWAWRNPVPPGDMADLVEHLTFTQVFDQTRFFWTIGPAWSLAVEVQFYLLLGLLGTLLVRWISRLDSVQHRLVALMGAVSCLIAASVAFKAVAWYVFGVFGDVWPIWFSLPAKLDVFGLGMLLAVLVALGSISFTRRTAAVVRLTGVLVFIASIVTRHQVTNEHLWFHSLAAVGFVLVLAASVLSPAGRVERLLGMRAPAMLGLVSYSLYLWHEPLMLWLRGVGVLPAPGSPFLLPIGLLVVIPTAVTVAWISYHLIEKPGTALRNLVDGRGRSRNYYPDSIRDTITPTATTVASP